VDVGIATRRGSARTSTRCGPGSATLLRRSGTPSRRQTRTWSFRSVGTRTI